MFENIRAEMAELYRFRELLFTMAGRDIRIKYKQSIMGVLWAFLMPALVVSAGILVRYGYAILSKTQLNSADVLAVCVKAVPWAFAVSSIRFACNSLIGNSGLVTKVYFPKEIFPFSAVLSQLVDFGVSSALIAAMLVIAGVGFHLVSAVWLAVLILTLLLLVTGTALLVSAASLFFRDVKYVVEVLLTFGIFFTPVLYDVETFGPRARLLLLNPIAPVLEGFRLCLIQQRSPEPAWLSYSFVIGLALLAGSYVFFKRLEPLFAEYI